MLPRESTAEIGMSPNTVACSGAAAIDHERNALALGVSCMRVGKPPVATSKECMSKGTGPARD
eukprot:6201637-Pleurochrysis_carterae.AAC.1